MGGQTMDRQREGLDLQQVAAQTRDAVSELLGVAGLKPGQVLVVGCSTSEVMGYKIGTASSMEVARVILAELMAGAAAHGVDLAIQCCEHLNRVLVVEVDVMERQYLDEVTVVPVPGAGGSLAAAAMDALPHPVVVERIVGHAGLDIGDTFIGMHLKPVVVPVRLSVKAIGHAHVTAARTRPKLVGGERARYCR